MAQELIEPATLPLRHRVAQLVLVAVIAGAVATFAGVVTGLADVGRLTRAVLVGLSFFAAIVGSVIVLDRRDR